ncbi:MAG TPA: tetratricopeptide repeat protein, partial [Bacteroidia bacterium]|nr:tetratricopeptide repeat protein [Bacteroidia bacterium]
MSRFLRLPALLLLLLPAFVMGQQNAELVNSGQLLFEGNLYYYLGKYGKAEETFKRVGRNDTNYAVITRDLARTYSDDDEDSLCLMTCVKGLDLHSVYDVDFYNYMGISLKEMNRYDSALKVYDKAIGLFPYAHLLYYNKGMVYYKQKNYVEAQKWFQEAVRINPYYSQSHFMLGKSCAEQGRIIPAVLSFEYFLMVDPSSDKAPKVVTTIEDLVTGDYQPDPDQKLDDDESGDKCFADVTDAINSQTALQAGYRNKTGINLKVVKQLQYLFEKLKYQEGTNNWWMDFYVPFYTELQ